MPNLLCEPKQGIDLMEELSDKELDKFQKMIDARKSNQNDGCSSEDC